MHAGNQSPQIWHLAFDKTVEAGRSHVSFLTLLLEVGCERIVCPPSEVHHRLLCDRFPSYTLRKGAYSSLEDTEISMRI
jgi:hypothetical protein